MRSTNVTGTVNSTLLGALWVPTVQGLPWPGHVGPNRQLQCRTTFRRAQWDRRAQWAAWPNGRGGGHLSTSTDDGANFGGRQTTPTAWGEELSAEGTLATLCEPTSLKAICHRQIVQSVLWVCQCTIPVEILQFEIFQMLQIHLRYIDQPPSENPCEIRMHKRRG